MGKTSQVQLCIYSWLKGWLFISSLRAPSLSLQNFSRDLFLLIHCEPPYFLTLSLNLPPPKSTIGIRETKNMTARQKCFHKQETPSLHKSQFSFWFNFFSAFPGFKFGSSHRKSSMLPQHYGLLTLHVSRCLWSSSLWIYSLFEFQCRRVSMKRNLCRLIHRH